MIHFCVKALEFWRLPIFDSLIIKWRHLDCLKSAMEVLTERLTKGNGDQTILNFKS